MLSHHQPYYYYQAHDQNQFLSAGQDLHKVLSDKEQKVISVSFADLFLKMIILGELLDSKTNVLHMI